MPSTMSIARASAEKMELSFGRTFPIIFMFKMVAHVVLSLSVEPSVNIQVIGMMFENIAEFILIRSGMDFCFGKLFEFKEHFMFSLVIYGGVLGMIFYTYWR